MIFHRSKQILARAFTDLRVALLKLGISATSSGSPPILPLYMTNPQEARRQLPDVAVGLWPGASEAEAYDEMRDAKGCLATAGEVSKLITLAFDFGCWSIVKVAQHLQEVDDGSTQCLPCEANRNYTIERTVCSQAMLLVSNVCVCVPLVVTGIQSDCANFFVSLGGCRAQWRL